jgi:3-oxoacyl-(acyl-carrier-protein) synthase III
MTAFVVNRHGRIVFPQNFFPRLDFRVFTAPEDFEAVIKRDFDEKHRSDEEVVARAASGRYRSRHELLRDLVSNVAWTQRYALTMYDKRPTRWRDVPRSRLDVFLPLVSPIDGGPLAFILESTYRALPAGEDAPLEDVIFGLMVEIVRHRWGDGTDVAARNPTVAEALANPRHRTYSLRHYDPDFPRYGEDDVIDFGHPSAELEALMRQAMVIRGQFRWDLATQRPIEVSRLRDDDVVILLHPRDEHVAAFLRGGRARGRVREEPVPAAATLPARALPPVNVRRQFTVMPRIEALAVYKGELACTNHDLVRNAALSWTPMTADDIERKTGIVERRYSELSLDQMALHAARAALARAGRGAHDVGSVIVCTCTSTRSMPSIAARLSAQLGVFQTHASYDLVAACAGLPYGVAAAVRLLQEVRRPVLVVLAEKFSDKVGTVRTSRMLFGDGAAAMVIGVAADRPDVEVFQTYASGPMSEVASIVWPNPEFDHGMTVYGPEVRALARRYLAQMFAEVKALPDPDGGDGTLMDAVDLIVPHQANQVMVAALAKDVGLETDRLFFNIARIGNTSAASIPIAIHDAVASGVIDRPQLVFAPGFGAGAVAGYVCLRVDPAVVAIGGA